MSSNPTGYTSSRYRQVAVLRAHADELEAFRNKLEKRFGRKVIMSEAVVIAVRKYTADAESVADEITAREMAQV